MVTFVITESKVKYSRISNYFTQKKLNKLPVVEELLDNALLIPKKRARLP